MLYTITTIVKIAASSENEAYQILLTAFRNSKLAEINHINSEVTETEEED